MSAPRLIVTTHDPKRATVRAALLVVLVLVAGWAVYVAGHARAGGDFAAIRAAELAVAEGQEGNRRLRERIAVLERSAQVDRQAYQELRGSLAGLNDEILQLREELAFYRGIVSPADARRGLRVHDIEILPAGGEAWRFRLMLIQAMQHDRQAQGTAHITLVGADADGPRSIVVVEGGLAYDFRYFQGFDGDILLPQGFVPDRIEVELAPRSERDSHVEQSFVWPAPVTVGG